MWQLRQLENLFELEPDLVASALEELLRSYKVFSEKMVIGVYLDGEISLAKAAELLEEHPVQLRKKLLGKGVPIRLGVESKEDLAAEAAAAQAI
jgi:predicted HTH domain antitoxin